MKWFLYGMGLVFIAGGSYFILYTQQSRSLLKKLLTEISGKVLAVIAFVMGLALLVSAAQSSHPWFIVILGIIAVGKGFLFFFNPRGVFENLRSWYLNQTTDQTFRFFGILMLILGTAVLSWVGI